MIEKLIKKVRLLCTKFRRKHHQQPYRRNVCYGVCAGWVQGVNFPGFFFHLLIYFTKGVITRAMVHVLP